jgi:hypothetical protein
VDSEKKKKSDRYFAPFCLPHKEMQCISCARNLQKDFFAPKVFA